MKRISSSQWVITLLVITACLFGSTLSADEIATLRQGAAINVEPDPVAIPQVLDEDIKEVRNYPMQPPVIPHDTRGYEVNLQVNKCMSCHARKRIEESQAPMVSVTHYMDREGNFLAAISPRRYFCSQCHVNQTKSRELVENTFEDMDEILTEKATRD